MGVPMEQSFLIRQASVRDAHGILECLQSAFEPYRDRYTGRCLPGHGAKPETILQRLLICVSMSPRLPREISLARFACEVVSPEEGHYTWNGGAPHWHGHTVGGTDAAGCANRITQ